jgi:hypothetical protein
MKSFKQYLQTEQREVDPRHAKAMMDVFGLDVKSNDPKVQKKIRQLVAARGNIGKTFTKKETK